jgi:uncharacterized membrane protein
LSKGRIEAFSDGVMAIIITIMVLGLVPPRGTDLDALRELAPVFLAYVLSFTFVAIYWNNHHHLFQAVHRVDGRVLWANMHLLFWLSLLPFVTGWMGENGFPPVPVATYGAVCFVAGLAYYLLERTLLAAQPADAPLAAAVAEDTKGKVSLVVYAASVVMALAVPILALAGYAIVALMWFIPDRRIERVVGR